MIQHWNVELAIVLGYPVEGYFRRFKLQTSLFFIGFFFGKKEKFEFENEMYIERFNCQKWPKKEQKLPELNVFGK
jgi:hypothetical protein